VTEGPTVEFRAVTKRFPGAVALREVSFDVRGGCHGLVGENGAGKSTLGKILAGILSPTAGEVRLAGRPVRFRHPGEALAAGVAMVHQELAFCEDLSVAENLCLGRLPRRGPFVARRVLQDRARALLAPLGMAIDVRQPVGQLSVAQQQIVQVAAVLSRGARVLVFDEPTSSLSRVESERLFGLVRDLAGRGVTSIYISHHLDEVFALCSRITVLRDGEVVGTAATAELDEAKLVSMMIGRSISAYFPRHLDQPRGRCRLRVEGLGSPGRFRDVSFSLHSGEVVGLAGLVGSGRSAVAEALFGLDPRAVGRVFIDDEPVVLRSPAQAMRRGLALVPEDRKRQGLVLSMSAKENISLPTLERLARWGWIRRAEERRLAQDYFDRLSVRAAGLDAPAASLSGGNQQKLVLAKWLAARADVLLIDEPTRGVDVAGKAEIHGLVDELARRGAAVLLISSELPEIINLSTRVLVMRQGRLVGELARAHASQDALVRLMAGLGPAAAGGTGPASSAVTSKETA